jgi:CrcB protein
LDTRSSRPPASTIVSGAAAMDVSCTECGRVSCAATIVKRADRRELAAIAGGGAVGGLARVALVQTGAAGAPGWPWITFAVNLLGAFLLGYFVTRLQERLPLSSYRRPLLGTGLCGGLSTFSTMQVEILNMLNAHAWALAASYTAVSVVAGYAAIYLATVAVRRVRVRVP